VPENDTILSSSSSVTDPGSIIPFFTRNPNTTSTFSSSSSTQPEEASADVSEQIADPADPSTSSVVPPELTSTAPLKLKY